MYCNDRNDYVEKEFLSCSSNDKFGFQVRPIFWLSFSQPILSGPFLLTVCVITKEIAMAEKTRV